MWVFVFAKKKIEAPIKVHKLTAMTAKAVTSAAVAIFSPLQTEAATITIDTKATMMERPSTMAKAPL